MEITNVRKLNNNYYSQSGQMLIIVVVTMAVALIVGLSLVSRTVTNVKIAQQNDESSRAFNAAEAGIQQSLQSLKINPNGGNITSPTLSNNANFSTSIVNENGNSLLISGGN